MRGACVHGVVSYAALGSCKTSPVSGSIFSTPLKSNALVPGRAQVADVPTLLGDGSDARKTHAVRGHEVVTGILLPPPVIGEQAAYEGRPNVVGG